MLKSITAIFSTSDFLLQMFLDSVESSFETQTIALEGSLCAWIPNHDVKL